VSSDHCFVYQIYLREWTRFSITLVQQLSDSNLLLEYSKQLIKKPVIDPKLEVVFVIIISITPPSLSWKASLRLLKSFSHQNYIYTNFVFLFLTFNSSKLYWSSFYYSKRNTWRMHRKLRIISLNIRRIILNFPVTLSLLGHISWSSVFFVWRGRSNCLMSWDVVSYDDSFV
jgi:hypothetical protein